MKMPIINVIMFARILKTLFAALLLFVILSSATAVLSGVSLFYAGKILVEESNRYVKSRGTELGTGLASLASPEWTGDRLVDLAYSMNEVVRDSRQRNDPVFIKEIFLLDRDGNVLAHNDVSRIAKESEIKYTGEDYDRVLTRPREEPTRLDVAWNYPEPENQFLRKIVEQFRKHVKEVPAHTYHLAVAVFPVDADIAKGSIHIYFENRGFLASLAVLPAMGKTLLFISLGFVFGGTFLYTLILFFMFKAKKADAVKPPVVTPANISEDPGLEVYESEPAIVKLKPVAVKPVATIHTTENRVLDAIPINKRVG